MMIVKGLSEDVNPFSLYFNYECQSLKDKLKLTYLAIFCSLTLNCGENALEKSLL